MNIVEKNENQKAMVKYFGEIPVQVIWKDGEPWFTAKDIGRALGYKDAGRRVIDLYNYHKDEFKDFVGVWKIQTPGGKQDTTIFSLKGLNLICMFSNQPKAKAFRQWALKVLEEVELTGSYNGKNNIENEMLDVPDEELNETNSMVKYFNGQPVYFIEKDGEAWFRPGDVGRILEYSHPARSVMVVIERNKDEFEGLYELYKGRFIILSRDAVNLVIMFSKQPKAKAFRRWLLKVTKDIQTTGNYCLQLDRAKDMLLETTKKRVEEAVNQIYYEELEKVSHRTEKRINRVLANFGGISSPELSPGKIRLLKAPERQNFKMIMDDKEAIEVFQRNYYRRKRPDDLITIAKAFKVLVDEYGVVRKAAKMLGVSRDYIRVYKKLLEHPKEIVKMIEERKIDSPTLAYKLIKIPLDIRYETAKKIIKMSFVKAEEFLDNIICRRSEKKTA